MDEVLLVSLPVEDSNSVNRLKASPHSGGSTRHIEMTPMNTIDTGTSGGMGGGMPTAGDNSWIGGGGSDHMTSLSPGLSTT